ncbi:PolC-type DNA polymerase III [Elusimicrobiota bacterium]
MHRSNIAERIISDDTPYCFLDCETTGLDPFGGDRICELAMLVIEKDKTAERFESLIDPQRSISLGAYHVNGITSEMLANKPVFKQVADKVRETLSTSIIVGHNVGFDLNFLKEEYKRIGVELKAVPAIDTLRLSRRLFSFKSYSLSAVAKSLKVGVSNEEDPNFRPHRAFSDVLLLREVFNRIVLEIKNTEGESSLPRIFELAGLWG